MAERLRRLDWIFERSPIYFITTCTHERRKILAQPFVNERLVRFAESGPERGAWMGAYVIMPDHLHLFVALGGVGQREDGDGHRPPLQLADGHRPPLQFADGHRLPQLANGQPPGGHRPPLQLGEWMKSLKNALSKVLREHDVEAPHWQKGYFDHVLRSAESYSEKWNYVRHNPVRAGLVGRWEDWPWLGEPFPLEYRRDRT